MKRIFFKRRSQKSGLPPGTLIHIGERKSTTVSINLINFTEADIHERTNLTVDEALAAVGDKGVKWIEVEGVHDIPSLEKIGLSQKLHPLVMEDILNTDQRPKVEDYGDYLYIVLKMLYFDEAQKEVVADQISIVLGKNYVVSFQEGVRDVFDPIRKRLRDGKGRIRKMGADYLAYSLIDAVVDNYFAIVEKYGDEIDNLEEDLVRNPNGGIIHSLHALKRDMLFLRRTIWPLRELVNTMQRGESALITESTETYLRDVQDHVVYLADTIETFRDMLSGMLDIYLTSINNRMNEIMKVLTIIATLFMPLTFLAGVYGMNFQFMPELGWKYGYPFVLSMMGLIAATMFWFFKKKKWL